MVFNIYKNLADCESRTYSIFRGFNPQDCTEEKVCLRAFCPRNSVSNMLVHYRNANSQQVCKKMQIASPLLLNGEKIEYYHIRIPLSGVEMRLTLQWDETVSSDIKSSIERSSILTLKIMEPVRAHNTVFSFEELFKNYDVDLNIDTISSDLFRITSPGGSSPNDATYRTLGQPRKFTQYLAWVRAAPYWLEPRTGSSKFTFEERGVGLICLRSDGIHVGIIGLSGLTDSCTTYLKPSFDSKSIQLYGQNDSQKPQSTAVDVLVTYGKDPEDMMKRLLEYSRKLVYGKVFTKEITVKASRLDWSPEWYDGLMYCTWNGLGLNMTHDKIINALQDLDNIGLRIDGIIIDDGWQSTSGDRQLYDFEAKESDFPTGLKGLVEDIKAKFPYINNIGVWSTVIGYWNGFIPDSKVDKMFNTIDVPYQSENKTIRIPRPDQAKAFYEKYFSFLANAGITCVKIDNQATFDEIRDPILRGKYWRPWQNELRAAALKYFDGKIIYCMAMVPDIMLYSMQKPLNRNETTPVFRNSDDFFPYEFKSHFWHIYCNFYNSVYTRNLMALPDYDMFQSKMKGDDVMYQRFPALHAAARAISGGPIYFTDTPERHDINLIKSFSAKDCSGNDIVLRLDGQPKPTEIYRAFDQKESTPLAVTNYYGNCGVLGLFNIGDLKTMRAVSLDDFDLPPSEWTGYAIRSYRADSSWISGSRNSSGEITPRFFSLESGEADILTAAPLVPISPGSSKRVAVFGTVDNMVGCAAVHSFTFEESAKGVLVTVNLKCFGMLGVTTTFLVDESIKDHAKIKGVHNHDIEIAVDEKSVGIYSQKKTPLIEVKLFLPFKDPILV